MELIEEVPRVAERGQSGTCIVGRCLENCQMVFAIHVEGQREWDIMNKTISFVTNIDNR